MSWHCSRALVEAFSAGTCSDGDVSAPSSTTPTPDQYYWPDKTTEHSRLSRFGTMCAPLTADRGEALLMSFLEASRARTSALPELEMGSMESAPASGRRWLESLAKFDLPSYSWKTAQCSLLEDLAEFSGTWPRWGSMRSGESWERETWAPGINGIAFGSPDGEAQPGCHVHAAMSSGATNTSSTPGSVSAPQSRSGQPTRMWPTPAARDYRHPNAKSYQERGGSKKGEQLPNAVGGPLNPEWVEWLMGWPIGWTDLKPLGTDRFREWQQQHGGCLAAEERKAA